MARNSGFVPSVLFGLCGIWGPSSEHNEGYLQLAVTSPSFSNGGAASGLRAISAQLSERLDSLQGRTAFSRLSIPARLILLVLALAVPLNLIIGGVIWGLVQRANEVQRTSLLYAARSIAAGVDAELGKYVALGKRCLAHRRCSTTISMRLRPRRAARSRPGQIPGHWSLMQMASNS